jgi:hypothetical protein
MIEPCSRCGEPTGHSAFLGGDDTAAERNCNLYRIGTELKRLNDNLDTLMATLLVNLPTIKWHING